MSVPRGVSLIQMLIVLMIASVLGAIAMALYRPTDVTARYQAEQLKGAIRHMQTIAMAWGVTLRLTTSSSAYTVTCDSSTTAPCPASIATAITDPATGSGFTVSVATGLTLGGPATALRIDSLGRPADASVTLLSTDSTYTLSAAGSPTSTVTVKPITGFTTVTP
jgi:Tfp pilus assembly major pilin PilA